MKKYIVLLGIAAITLASCTLEESRSVAPVQYQNGTRLQLSGNSYVGTKVSIGEKDGDTYPLLWYTGDVISINSVYCSVDTLGFNGELATLYSETSGKATGLFQTVNDLEAIEDMDLVILYPGSSLTYANGVITGNVPVTQNQRSASSSIHVGNYCFSYAETSIEQGQTEGISFDLTQKTAFVKVIVKNMPSDYTKYPLYGATLSCDGAVLAGDITYDIAAGEATYSNTADYVGAVITNTATMSSEESIYFTALPYDLTGQQCLLTVLFQGDGNETVSIPFFVDGGLLKESCLTVIEIDGSNSTCPAWYDPVETRDLVNNAWAYGKQNTYYVEQYDSAPNSITIDVRARGNFSHVTEPKYYGLMADQINNKHLCYLPDGTNSYEEQPTNEIGDDYTITVNLYSKSEGDGPWNTVAIYDEDYNVLWSFMICKYYSGDEPQTVSYDGGTYKLMDRNLGFIYSSKLAAEKGTFGDNYNSAFFQWGRKDPFAFYRYPSHYSLEPSSTLVDVAAGIAHPDVVYYQGGDSDWLGDKTNTLTLWGGPVYHSDGDYYTTTVKGVKTIYDPCPEGYRVPDEPLIYYVFWDNGGERWEVNEACAAVSGQTVKSDSPFYDAGQSCAAVKADDGNYDYWPYNGYMYNTSTFFNNGDCDGHSGLGYHSCSYRGYHEYQCIGIWERLNAEKDFVSRVYVGRTEGHGIRCQVDEENR